MNESGPRPAGTWMLEELVEAVAAEALADPAHPTTAQRMLADAPDGTARHMKAGLVALPPGFRGVPHVHDAEELTICLRGSGTFTIGDEELRVEPGTVLWTPADAPHVAHAAEDGDLMVLLYGYAPVGAPITRLPEA